MTAAVGLGLVIGVLLGLLGGGGSILAVPALVAGAGVPLSAAIPTSLLVVGISSATAVLPRLRSGQVAWRIAGVFGVAGAMAAFTGAAVNRLLDPRLVLLGFAALMVAAGVRMLREQTTVGGDCALPGGGVNWRRCLPKAIGSGVGVGFLTGLFGVGGGFLIIPALVLLLGLPMTVAVGTSLLIIVANSAAGFTRPRRRSPPRLRNHNCLHHRRCSRLTRRRPARPPARRRPAPPLVRLPRLRRRRLRHRPGPAQPLCPGHVTVRRDTRTDASEPIPTHGSTHDLHLVDQRHLHHAVAGEGIVLVDFFAMARREAAALARRPDVDVRWVHAYVATWVAEQPDDLVITAYRHLPGVQRRQARCAAAAAQSPSGSLLVVGRDTATLIDGVGGPRTRRCALSRPRPGLRMEPGWP